jgi:hypothetical protein
MSYCDGTVEGQVRHHTEHLVGDVCVSNKACIAYRCILSGGRYISYRRAPRRGRAISLVPGFMGIDFGETLALSFSTAGTLIVLVKYWVPQ